MTLVKSGKLVKKLGKTVDKESKRMQSAWSKSAASIKSNVLGLASFTAAMFAIRGAVKTVLAFEDAMAEVSTIVDTNIVNMHKLNSEILDLSTRVPKDAESLAQGLYQTISAGVTDVSDAMIVLESSSKAATAGLTSTFVAVDAGTTIMNAYGKTVQDIDAIQDVLFNTVKEGKTKYDSLATSIGRAAPIAAQVGVSFEELTAAAATLTKGGLSTEEAMTAIRATMVGILKPSSEAEQLANKLGLEFNTAGLKAKGLSGFLEEVTEKTGGNTDAITQLFGNVRALTGVMALAGNQADEFSRILESNTKAAGVMTEAYEKMEKTATAQWQLLKNQLNKVLIELGVDVLPVATTAMSKLNETMAIDGFLGTLVKLFGPVAGIGVAIVGMGIKAEETKESIKDLNKELFAFTGPQLPEKPGDDDGEAIIPELTKQQQTILAIKKEILAAEQMSKLTQMAINQIEAERIANAKSLFGEVEKIGVLFTEEGGIVSGMREWQSESQKTADNLAKIGIEILPLGVSLTEDSRSAEEINQAFDRLNPKIKLAGQDSATWASNTADVRAKLFEVAGALNSILQMATGAQKFSISNILGIGAGIAALIPGGQPIALGLQAGAIATRGLQHGGDFKVGGSGGADSQLVAFRASPRETVSVRPPGVGGGGDININPVINVTGSGLTKSEVMEAARPGIDLIAAGVKRAISSRQIMKKDLEKAQ